MYKSAATTIRVSRQAKEILDILRDEKGIMTKYIIEIMLKEKFPEEAKRAGL